MSVFYLGKLCFVWLQLKYPSMNLDPQNTCSAKLSVHPSVNSLGAEILDVYERALKRTLKTEG